VGTCLQLALYASPQAKEREKIFAPTLAAYGTGRWTYLDHAAQRRVYTLIDGAFSGAPAAADRDGLDIKSSQSPGGNQLEFADAEILENAYPLLFVDRHASTGVHGYGRHRSGSGYEGSFRAHNTDTLVGNMTGTRAWFPTGGGAGGYPGATMRYFVHRADGTVEPIDIHHVGLALGPGDIFEMKCASGGGYGDPLDREAAAVHRDIAENRVDPAIARDVYGVAFAADGSVDAAATEARRTQLRQDRLRQARPAAKPARATVDENAPAGPLYAGVVQHGNLAVSERSGEVLAVAPDNWLDGCPVLDTPIDGRAGGTIMRAHLDPGSGRALFIDVIRKADGPSIAVLPDRWARAGQELSQEGVAA
jgi:N-methylhydantoinase B